MSDVKHTAEGYEVTREGRVYSTGNIGRAQMPNQFTPGPWVGTVDADGDNVSIVTEAKFDEGFGLYPKNVIGGCGCCGSPFTREENAEANVRLIAAAPEMLEALKACQMLLSDLEAQLQTRFATLELVSAALAKASGETP